MCPTCIHEGWANALGRRDSSLSSRSYFMASLPRQTPRVVLSTHIPHLGPVIALLPLLTRSLFPDCMQRLKSSLPRVFISWHISTPHYRSARLPFEGHPIPARESRRSLIERSRCDSGPNRTVPYRLRSPPSSRAALSTYPAPAGRRDACNYADLTATSPHHPALPVSLRLGSSHPRQAGIGAPQTDEYYTSLISGKAGFPAGRSPHT